MTATSPRDLPYDSCSTASEGAHPTPDHLLQSAMGFWHSALLLSAHELGLFTVLVAGPCDASALEDRLGLRHDTTVDYLEALVALGLLERHNGLYRYSAEASRFCNPTQSTYIGRWFDMARAAMRDVADLTTHLRADVTTRAQSAQPVGRMWGQIADILRTGSAANET